METKILKLKNGEELVCNVYNTDGDFLKVQNPLKVNLYPRMKGGKIEEAMAFLGAFAGIIVACIIF